MINLSPLEGDGELFVNPGAYKEDLSKSMFSVKKQAKKRIIIMREELKNLGLNAIHPVN